MTSLGDRLDGLVGAAFRDFNPPPAHEVIALGRRRRARRRVVTAAAGAVVVVVATVTGLTVGRGGSTLRVTTRPPVAAPTGPPPLIAIARVSSAAAALVSGPPAALGEVVGATTTTALNILAGLAGGPTGAQGRTDRPEAAPSTDISKIPDTAIWWVLITRHHACPPGCAYASAPPTQYVTVLVRASDLAVLDVRSLGSEPPDLAVAGPVYPLVLPGQKLPSSQTVIGDHLTVVPAATVEAADLKGEGCPVPAHLSGLRDSLPAGPGVRCTSVTVRLFPDWAALASSVPRVVEPGLAFSQPNRPLYYVTIWGQFRIAVLGPRIGLGQQIPVFVDHDNGIYDAITGAGESGGTAGEPLP